MGPNQAVTPGPSRVDIPIHSGTIDDFYYLLVVFDILVTAIWYGLTYGRWRAGESEVLTARVGKVAKVFVVPWRAVRDFGRTKPAKVKT